MTEAQDVSNHLTNWELRILNFLTSLLWVSLLVFFYMTYRFNLLEGNSDSGLFCIHWPQPLGQRFALSLMLFPFGGALIIKILLKCFARRHGINDVRLSMEMSRPKYLLKRSMYGPLIVLALEVVHQLVCAISR